MFWTRYVDFIWNTFLFQCVGVDPQISSASAAPSSVSPAVRSLIFSKSIRFIFLMSAIFRPEIILRFISPGTLWDSFVNSLRMIYHLWILSPLLLIFPNQTQRMWLTSGGSILYYFIIIIHNNYWHFDEKSFFP